jgi:hypothetical protein
LLFKQIEFSRVPHEVLFRKNSEDDPSHPSLRLDLTATYLTVGEPIGEYLFCRGRFLEEKYDEVLSQFSWSGEET